MSKKWVFLKGPFPSQPLKIELPCQRTIKQRQHEPPDYVFQAISPNKGNMLNLVKCIKANICN